MTSHLTHHPRTVWTLLLAVGIGSTSWAGGLGGCNCNKGAAGAYVAHGHHGHTVVESEAADCETCGDHQCELGLGHLLAPVHGMLAHGKVMYDPGQWIMDLRNCDAKIRAHAAEQLGKYSLSEYPDIEGALAKALVNDCDKHVRLAAVHSLKQLRACSHIAIEAYAHAKLDECLLVKLAACKAANICAKSRSTCPSCHGGCGGGCAGGSCYNEGPIVGEPAYPVQVEHYPPAMSGAEYIPQGHKRMLNASPEPPRGAEPYVIGNEQFEPRIGDVRSIPRRYDLPDGSNLGYRETLPVIPPQNDIGYYVVPRTR